MGYKSTLMWRSVSPGNDCTCKEGKRCGRCRRRFFFSSIVLSQDLLEGREHPERLRLSAREARQWVGGREVLLRSKRIRNLDASPERFPRGPGKTHLELMSAFAPQFVEARFTYHGPTGNEVRLGSGELRRQFGLKLRAQDACNLVYAMWRIEPESKLVVSVKSNPGQHSSAQCGNRGYRNIKPRRSTPVPALRSGDAHTLRAEMNGAEIEVFVDNSLVWEGSVGPDALGFDGPVGIRSDNVRLQMDLRAGQPLKAQPGSAAGCRSGGEESE